MATRIMFFTGGFPLGALAQTAISDATSPRIVVTTAGALVLLIGFYLATKADWLAALDDPPDI